MMQNALIVFVAKYLIIVSPILVLIAWIFRDKTKQVSQWTFFFLTILLTGVIGFIAGHLYVHARPFVITGIPPLIAHAADNGFPSDHTLLTAAIATGLWKISRRTSLMAWIIAILVGIARILAGVHWPADIIGSIVIALVAGIASWGIMFVIARK